MREWLFHYGDSYCEECDDVHDISVLLNIDTEDRDVAMEAEGVAYHEAIRSCSPVDSDLWEVAMTGRSPHPANKTYKVRP